MPRLNPLTILPRRKADFIEPMDCAPVQHLLDGPQWLFEINLDGTDSQRILRRSRHGMLTLFFPPRIFMAELSVSNWCCSFDASLLSAERNVEMSMFSSEEKFTTGESVLTK